MTAPKGHKYRLKHGLWRHPLYMRFVWAKSRCTNPNNNRYKTYKGRWGKNTPAELTQHYLEEYEQWVKDNPGKKPSIDRIDEDGRYEIGNVQIIGRGENIKKYNRIKGHPNKGRFGEKHHSSKPIEGLIDGKWVQFAGGLEAQREIGIWHQNINAACNGKLKTAGKDKNGNRIQWRYAI